jgi:hypothetical protein
MNDANPGRRPQLGRELDPRFLIGPRWLNIYRNSNDPRLLLRKTPRWLGWTVNLAHPLMRFAFAVFVLCLALAIGVVIAHLPR